MAVTLPEGFSAAGGSCGIKADGSFDLGVIVTDAPVSWAGTFTRNAAAAAPVLWCRARLGTTVRAVVVNSGNANACTGAAGERAVETTAGAVAAALSCSPQEVLVASTGPIGIPLPADRVTAAVPGLIEAAGSGVEDFTRSILTTDTIEKTSVADAGGASIVGMAKGAAMLAPNMATMLAFVVTDAELAAGELQACLSRAVELSFNRISVDACESTNDSVILLASGRRPVDPDVFAAALTGVCRDLAEQMVRDAEGGSRFVRIDVSGARDDSLAADLGHAVASSALWRAAVHGSDPNWGRVLSALGACDRSLDLHDVTLSIGDVVVFERGEPVDARDDAASVMGHAEFTVHCSVGTGPGTAEVLTSDLSPDYVKLNAEGTL